MSAAPSPAIGPFAHFGLADTDISPLGEDRDLDALERLFDHLKDEARALRADARTLGHRIERLRHSGSHQLLR